MNADISRVTTEALRRELARREAEQKKKPFVVDSPVGWWHVTTEGDCEGRSTRDLGIHHGHLGDIALALAGSTYYVLHFSPLPEENEIASRTKNEATVSFSTFANDGHRVRSVELAPKMEAWLGSGWTVSPGNHYKSVKISKRE